MFTRLLADRQAESGLIVTDFASSHLNHTALLLGLHRDSVLDTEDDSLCTP